MLALGDNNGGKVEVWDVKNEKSVECLVIDKGNVKCMASTKNILAVGSADDNLQLWDVRSWERFYSETVQVCPQSLHLTTDARYLTIGGYTKDQCVVLKIQ